MEIYVRGTTGEKLYEIPFFNYSVIIKKYIYFKYPNILLNFNFRYFFFIEDAC